MKSRFALTLLVLIPLLAACNAQSDTSAAATAPVVAEPAAAPVEATPEGSTPADASAATGTAPVVAGAPTGPAPVAGTDYVELANGQPYAPLNGQVEVVEVFGYTCPHCAQFEPEFQAWKQRQAADVAVVQVPAAFGGYWLPYARAFYAAEALGVLPQSHDAMFNAIHVQRSLPVNNNVTAEQIAPFYAQYGVDAKRFADTFNSFGVDAKINRAKQFAVKTRIEGTPAIVVNGKYTVPVDQQGFGKMLNTVDWLVAKERGGAN